MNYPIPEDVFEKFAAKRQRDNPLKTAKTAAAILLNMLPLSEGYRIAPGHAESLSA
jgi:hypothetical protein